MNISRQLHDRFDPVVSHVKQTFNSVIASGSALIVIHNDSIVSEEYWGRHSSNLGSRPIQEDTQFHVASVRKSYIGFAVAYARYKGYIASIDDQVIKYLSDLDANLLHSTTIRHLLTHTHGLNRSEGTIYREFAPGKSWAYRGIGIDMLTQIVKITTGKTVAEIVTEQVFQPLGFKQSGWYGNKNDKLVEVILRHPNDPAWYTSESTDGDKMNMYVSARELAYWGYLHLQEGLINKKQIIPREIINLATSVQSPKSLDLDLPQNGYLWFLKDLPSKKTEIGENVPQGTYQILGYTGSTVLVIPKHNLVAVRMFNSFGSPTGFDYLEDIRSFGDTIMKCILNDSKRGST
ncbi:serine hydrolase domain-containing protein [Brevibacillus daliensis]|uniref:serine hydrolase domain-containing protein n=1 Tax=Brevibacillus daliensis TaxID=2892995 RepID=UPI001E4AB739|nr:serine hydrolase domain-containing protein [Brevibacillus daliensis]